jgi:two-component system sensor histidine kinase QseC
MVLVLTLVAVVWLAAAVMTWFDARHELDELLDSHLAQAAALLVVQQAGELEDDDHGVDAPVLHRYAPKVAFQVFHEGRLALRSANVTTAPMVGPDEKFTNGFRTVRIDGTEWRVFATRGAKRDIQVYVGEQIDSRAAILRAILRSTLWPTVVALPLLALAIWWAVHRGMTPLRKLGHVLAERGPHALHPVDLPQAPVEMQPMLDSLNALFARIGALMESERRFTADAAHELRTPIAAIRAQAQVAMGECSDTGRRHALQATLEGCDRATRLVEQLLTLSRLEGGAMPPLSGVDLPAVARSVVADLASAAARKQQRIEVDAGGDCRVSGDATLLAVLVRNLVDNAIRYSPAAAVILVRVAPGTAADATKVRLQVEDSGPGLGDADRQRLGERFFRVLGNEESGSGLGWSIVRRIAEVHLADLELDSSPALGGLRVTVTLAANLN